MGWAAGGGDATGAGLAGSTRVGAGGAAGGGTGGAAAAGVGSASGTGVGSASGAGVGSAGGTGSCRCPTAASCARDKPPYWRRPLDAEVGDSPGDGQPDHHFPAAPATNPDHRRVDICLPGRLHRQDLRRSRTAGAGLGRRRPVGARRPRRGIQRHPAAGRAPLTIAPGLGRLEAQPAGRHLGRRCLGPIRLVHHVEERLQLDDLPQPPPGLSGPGDAVCSGDLALDDPLLERRQVAEPVHLAVARCGLQQPVGRRRRGGHHLGSSHRSGALSAPRRTRNVCPQVVHCTSVPWALTLSSSSSYSVEQRSQRTSMAVGPGCHLYHRPTILARLPRVGGNWRL